MTCAPFLGGRWVQGGRVGPGRSRIVCSNGCKAAGAARIIGVDIKADKFDIGRH